MSNPAAAQILAPDLRLLRQLLEPLVELVRRCGTGLRIDRAQAYFDASTPDSGATDIEIEAHRIVKTSSCDRR